VKVLISHPKKWLSLIVYNKFVPFFARLIYYGVLLFIYLCFIKSKVMKSYILLENIVFYAYHGVFPQERAVGNVYIINLKIEVDLSKAGDTDRLEDTISYADVYDIVKQEMARPSNLLEHVAKRIITRLRAEYSLISGLEIKLSKRNPPIGGQLDYASVVLID